jgi:TolB-like protein/Tfp pilus assembly protein PilF
MEDKNILEEIRPVLRKSRREPSKFIELIACILDMNQEGEIASYPKIVRRLWPEKWQQAKDKVAFEIAKWDLLRRRRREINERVFHSHLCFHFFIDLSQAKAFHVLTEPKEIYAKRLEELEEDLGKTKPKPNREKIKAQINELTSRFWEFELGNRGEPADEGDIMEPHPEGAGEDRQKSKPARWKWAAAGIAAVLVILATAVVIKNRSFHPVSPPEVLELSGKPFIAVLPFKNLSEDPDLDYFCDGLTEGIITTLGKTPKMMVIASTSSFTYKDKMVNIQQVAKELNVRHILEGSARKSGDRIRISAQLIDAESGKHLWAEGYDRYSKELFALQDEVTLKILTELQVNLTEGEKIRLFAKGTDNLKAYLIFLRGYYYYGKVNPDYNTYAQQCFQQAIELDPDYAEAYAMLAHTYLAEVRNGLSKSPQKSIEQAFNLAQKALAKDESSATGRRALSRVYLFQGKYDKAIAEAERAITLAPNNDIMVTWVGITLMNMERPEEAIPYFEKAIRLNPLSPFWAVFLTGSAYRDMGKYEKAIPFYKEVLSKYPDIILGNLNLAICYAGVGREKEARPYVANALKIDPKITASKYIKDIPMKDTLIKHYIELLRKAGLPD